MDVGCDLVDRRCLFIHRFSLGNPVPWWILHFLEDASRGNLLRTVGPVYQFQHTKRQDRLAQQEASRY